MSSVAVIRAQVEKPIPGALRVYERPAPEVFLTGIPAIDRDTGGIPKSALTQICAPAGVTSGRTTVLLSLLAQVTGLEQFCALRSEEHTSELQSRLHLVCRLLLEK